MAMARHSLVDLAISRLYHCISQCVRGACLCGEGYEHRKDWIEQRLEELASIFAIDVGSYSVLGTHFHVVVGLYPERVDGWSDREVVLRWAQLYPPRDKKRQPVAPDEQWIAERLADPEWLAETRERLGSLSWFMKCLKEPLAKQANKEDNAPGAFWAERYRSIAILDTESLLATLVYVDLNELAAGICQLPEQSPHSSIRARVEHYDALGKLEELKAGGDDVPSMPAVDLEGWQAAEQSHWLCPLGDLRGLGAERVGLLEGLTLRGYLQLLDVTSRMHREGKASMSREAAGILERLGTSQEQWHSKYSRLQGMPRRAGTVLGRADQLQRVAERRGVSFVKNLFGRANK